MRSSDNTSATHYPLSAQTTESGYTSIDIPNTSQQNTSDQQDAVTAFHTESESRLDNQNFAYLKATCNFIIFGGMYGAFYGLTGLAGGINTFKNNRAFGTTLGVMGGMAGGTSNFFQAPQATRSLFESNYFLWLSTAIILPTLGGYAALPFIAAVLQSLDVLGSTSKSLNTILGCITFITTGITFSVGLTNLLSMLLNLLMWHKTQDKKYLFPLMESHIASQARSAHELNTFSPDDTAHFFEGFYAWKKNILLVPLSLLAGCYLGYSIAPEIPKALAADDKDNIYTMKILISALHDFASSEHGSKLISILTNGLLCSFFAYDSLHTIARDIYESFKHPEKRQSITKLFLFSLFIGLTGLTGALQSEKSTDGKSPIPVILTYISVYAINWSGSRLFIFEKFLPAITSCFKQNTDITHDDDVTATNTIPPSHYTLEKDARINAYGRLMEAMSQHQRAQEQTDETSPLISP